MTVKDLVDVTQGYDELIQICCGDNYDQFDTFRTDSVWLESLYDYKVLTLEAIDTNIYRIELVTIDGRRKTIRK